MLGLLRNQAAFCLPRHAQRLSGVLAATGNSLTSGPNVVNPPPPTPCASSSSTTVTHPYFVPRNTKGNLPVYTDVRNAGGRYLVLIRNVEGNAAVCVFVRPLFLSLLIIPLNAGTRKGSVPVSV
jgi:hypothetical protein